MELRAPDTCPKRDEIILAALAPARGASFTPVQVQKLFFLLDARVAKLVGGPYFHFQPYHYGPFDAGVYTALEDLARRRLVEIERGSQSTMRTFRLTPAGQDSGERALAALDGRAQEFIRTACTFVRRLSFSALVSAIYKSFPAMKERSVFRE
jgi:hypothetical protein